MGADPNECHYSGPGKWLKILLSMVCIRVHISGKVSCMYSAYPALLVTSYVKTECFRENLTFYRCSNNKERDINLSFASGENRFLKFEIVRLCVCFYLLCFRYSMYIYAYLWQLWYANMHDGEILFLKKSKNSSRENHGNGNISSWVSRPKFNIWSWKLDWLSTYYPKFATSFYWLQWIPYRCIQIGIACFHSQHDHKQLCLRRGFTRCLQSLDGNFLFALRILLINDHRQCWLAHTI